MVGTPRDMTLIIAGFFTQNLPTKAVELMSNGFLLGWCQLQELFTSSHAPRGRLSSPFASIPNGRCGFGKVFGNIFEIPEKERLFIHFSFIFYASALLCQSLRNADAGGRGGKTALTGLAEVGGEQAAHAAHGVDDLITGCLLYTSDAADD